MVVTELTSEADYKQALSNKLVIVCAGADWCGPCHMISPTFEKFSEEFPAARFYRFDVDKVTEVASITGVRAMPTFYFYQNSALKDTAQGADRNKLRAAIEKFVSNA